MKNQIHRLILALLCILGATACSTPPQKTEAPPVDTAKRDVVYAISDCDQGPKEQLRVPPRYPHEMQKNNISGKVISRLTIDPKGNVADVYVVSATNPLFAQTAKNALLQWKFTPGMKNGKPVYCRFTLPIAFEPPK